MGRQKKGIETEADLTKPCRCGSGFYCHRHLRYGGTTDDCLTPVLRKVKKGRTKQRPKYRPSTGGEY